MYIYHKKTKSCYGPCSYKQVTFHIHVTVNMLKTSQSLLERRHQGTPVSSSSAQILTVGLELT